jgi:hypothetical protein
VFLNNVPKNKRAFIFWADTYAYIINDKGKSIDHYVNIEINTPAYWCVHTSHIMNYINTQGYDCYYSENILKIQFKFFYETNTVKKYCTHVYVCTHDPDFVEPTSDPDSDLERIGPDIYDYTPEMLRCPCVKCNCECDRIVNGVAFSLV